MRSWSDEAAELAAWLEEEGLEDEARMVRLLAAQAPKAARPRPVEPFAAAAELLQAAARVLGEAPEAQSCGHLARACRLRATTARATVVVDVGSPPPPRFTCRQDQVTGAMTLIDRLTGERRVVALQDLARAGSAEAAWRTTPDHPTR